MDVIEEMDIPMGRPLYLQVQNSTFVFDITYTNTSQCHNAELICTGSSVPRNHLVPYFYITCGTDRSYVGPDLYHFAPKSTSIVESYKCASPSIQDLRPKWRLLGYFSSSQCPTLSNTTYNSTFCHNEENSKTSIPSSSPSLTPTITTSVPSNQPIKPSDDKKGKNEKSTDSSFSKSPGIEPTISVKPIRDPSPSSLQPTNNSSFHTNDNSTRYILEKSNGNCEPNKPNKANTNNSTHPNMCTKKQNIPSWAYLKNVDLRKWLTNTFFIHTLR